MTLTFWKRLLKDEEGQDLIEYTLLLAFVCLVAAGIFINAGKSASSIWEVANSMLASAASVVS